MSLNSGSGDLEYRSRGLRSRSTSSDHSLRSKSRSLSNYSPSRTSIEYDQQEDMETNYQELRTRTNSPFQQPVHWQSDSLVNEYYDSNLEFKKFNELIVALQLSNLYTCECLATEEAFAKSPAKQVLFSEGCALCLGHDFDPAFTSEHDNFQVGCVQLTCNHFGCCHIVHLLCLADCLEEQRETIQSQDTALTPRAKDEPQLNCAPSTPTRNGVFIIHHPHLLNFLHVLPQNLSPETVPGVPSHDSYSVTLTATHMISNGLIFQISSQHIHGQFTHARGNPFVMIPFTEDEESNMPPLSCVTRGALHFTCTNNHTKQQHSMKFCFDFSTADGLSRFTAVDDSSTWRNVLCIGVKRTAEAGTNEPDTPFELTFLRFELMSNRIFPQPCNLSKRKLMEHVWNHNSTVPGSGTLSSGRLTRYEAEPTQPQPTHSNMLNIQNIQNPHLPPVQWSHYSHPLGGLTSCTRSINVSPIGPSASAALDDPSDLDDEVSIITLEQQP